MPIYAIPQEEVDYVTLIDEDGANTYVGLSLPGNQTSVAAWKIKRISEISGETTISWADGSIEFDKIWDDRATFSYNL